jgi:ABC-type polysaccharide/polyol phosphate export permease
VVEELSREGAHVEAPPPSEPPPELWFRRRIHPLASLRELWQFRELTLSLAERDLRIRYSQAALGVAWAVLTPLLLMLAFGLVFTKFTRIDTQGAPYSLFAYLGLVPWTFFASAVANGGTSLTLNVPLLNKLYCPREVFPLAQVLVAAVDAVMATVVLFLLFAITGYAPRAEAVWVPLLLLVLLAFTTGCTIAISVIVVYLRDLRLALPLALQFGIVVTPVAYGADVIAHSTARLTLYAALDPLVAVIDGLRRTVLWGEAPQAWPLLAGAGTSTLVLLGGFLLFKRLETGIADIA